MSRCMDHMRRTVFEKFRILRIPPMKLQNVHADFFSTHNTYTSPTGAHPSRQMMMVQTTLAADSDTIPA